MFYLKQFLNRIILLALKYANASGRAYDITGRKPGDNSIYMKRFVIFKSKWFRIYIHKFIRSDDPIFHDHPWSFLTYVVSHGYKEHILQNSTESVRSVEKGAFLFRKSTHIHWVELYPNTYPITLCVIGPKLKDWGFWRKLNGSFERLNWRDYLGLPKDFQYVEKRIINKIPTKNDKKHST